MMRFLPFKRMVTALSVLFFTCWVAEEARTSVGFQEQTRAEQEPVGQSERQSEAYQPTESERLQFASLEDRTRYEEQMLREPEKAEEEVEELEARRSIPGGVERLKVLRESVDELKDLLEAARSSLESLEGRAGDAWLRARRELESDVRAFWSAVRDLKVRFRLI